MVFEGKQYIEGLDLAGCAMACQNDPNCKAFSFDRWRGICYLKDRVAVSSTIDPPSIIGVKLTQKMPPSNADGKMRMHRIGDKRFYDTPIAATVAKSFAECRQQCSDHPRCFVHTFIAAESRCMMYETTDGPYYSEAASSGFKQQEPVIPKSL
jgi:hypothetical protein